MQPYSSDTKETARPLSEMQLWKMEDNARKRRLGISVTTQPPGFISKFAHWIAAGVFVAVCIYYSV